MPNFVSFAASVAELARGEKSHTHSLTQLIWCPGNRSYRFGTFSTGAVLSSRAVNGLFDWPIPLVSFTLVEPTKKAKAGASNPHYGWEISPPHLTRKSTVHIVWAEHGGTILLFGPVWFGYSNAVVRISTILSYVLFTWTYSNTSFK